MKGPILCWNLSEVEKKFINSFADPQGKRKLNEVTFELLLMLRTHTGRSNTDWGIQGYLPSSTYIHIHPCTRLASVGAIDRGRGYAPPSHKNRSSYVLWTPWMTAASAQFELIIFLWRSFLFLLGRSAVLCFDPKTKQDLKKLNST